MTDLPVDFPRTLVLTLCAGGVLLGGLLLLPPRYLGSRFRACLLGAFWLLLVVAAAYLSRHTAAFAVALAALAAILTVSILAHYPRLVGALPWRHLPAVLLLVKGEATVGVGDDIQAAQAGTMIHMRAHLKHSIKAKTPVVCSCCCC